MCKTLLTIVLLFSFSFIASAQFNKGDLLVGGQLGYGSNKSSNGISPDTKNNGGNFSLSLGKALSSNSVFGFSLGYSPSSQSNYFTNFGYVNYKYNTYSVGVFYRVYKTLAKDFYIFGSAGIGYQRTTTSGKDSTGNEFISGSGNGGSLSFVPGLAYRVSKKVFLEISIPQLFSASYTNQKTTQSGVTSSQDQFNIGANLSSNTLSNLGIGFTLVL